MMTMVKVQTVGKHINGISF